jgi:hypothetical protein
MPDRIEEIGQALRSFDEEQQASLRQTGKNDPPPGAPLRYQHGRDPNDVVMIEPGQWEPDGWADQRTGLPPGCPVIPLGKEGPTCYFLDTLGAVYELHAQSSGKGPIESMFGGRTRYLEWAWPRWSQPRRVKRTIENAEGETIEEFITVPSRVIGWEADRARQDLVNACAYTGVYSYAELVRGRGAWRAADGSLIYHAGDRVLAGGRWRDPGEIDGMIYPRRPPIGRPSARPQPAGPGSAGDELFEMLQSFNWDRPDLDARLVLGWLMTAKIGGALPRRPVLFVHGGEGSGKSTLHELMRGAMNGALIATAETSQAGIYHHLKQDSVAILIDELEAKDDTRAIHKILTLARIAYSGDKMHRGGKDGVGQEFTLMSSFMASAVSKPATEAQDDSRMAVVMLREREAAGAKLEIKPAWIDATGRHLLRRLFDWWPRWAELVGVIRAALIEVGHNDRSADTFAPLAAGCHAALRDDMPEPGELVDWQRWLNPALLDEIANRERTWRRCLLQLLNAAPDAWRQYTSKTVGGVLTELRDGVMNAKEADTRLQQIGLSLSWPNEHGQDYESARLFVPSNHPAVQALFEGTSWAGSAGSPGPWAGVLRQAPRELWERGVSGKGLDKKAKGLLIDVARALDASDTPAERA